MEDPRAPLITEELRAGPGTTGWREIPIHEPGGDLMLSRPYWRTFRVRSAFLGRCNHLATPQDSGALLFFLATIKFQLAQSMSRSVISTWPLTQWRPQV
jgi:hypothetical protein